MFILIILMTNSSTAIYDRKIFFHLFFLSSPTPSSSSTYQKKTKSSSDSDRSGSGGLRTASLDRLGRRGPPHQTAHVHHTHNPHYTLPRRQTHNVPLSVRASPYHSQHHIKVSEGVLFLFAYEA